MPWVGLDANVIAESSAGPSAKKLSAHLEDRRRRGETLVVVPQIITECEQAPERIADRLLVAIKTSCDGILARDAKNVLVSELVSPNPFQAAVDAGLLPAGRIMDARRSRKKESVQGFLQAQRLGYEELRQMMPDFDAELKKAGKYQVEPFSEFIAERRWALFEAFIRYCVEQKLVRIRLPTSRSEWERLWKKAQSFRLIVLVYAANEWRRGARIGKLEGCITDLRVLMESAYLDEFVTMDKDLFGCGELLRTEGLLVMPRFTLWTA